MASSYNSQANPGLFVPTTNIWDVQQLYSTDVNSEEFKELLVRLYQNINNISMALNLKDTGYYTIQEFLNGQVFFPDPALSSTTSQTPTYRQVFRTTVNFETLPNAASKSVAHNIAITSGYSFTRIYGAATNTARTSFIPLPFASPTLNQNIKLEATATNVVITTAIDYTAYTVCYIVLEYIKQ